MTNGYIKLWRKSLQNDLFSAGPFDQWHAWEYLLLRAAWRDHQIILGGKVIDLKRGQIATSIHRLADEWGWGKDRASLFVKHLSDLHMTTSNSRPIARQRYFVITISNYDSYQSSDDGDPPDTRQIPARYPPDTRQTPARHKARREEDKKGEEGKEVKTTPPSEAAGRKKQTLESNPVYYLTELYCENGGLDVLNRTLAPMKQLLGSGIATPKEIEAAILSDMARGLKFWEFTESIKKSRGGLNGPNRVRGALVHEPGAFDAIEAAGRIEL